MAFSIRFLGNFEAECDGEVLRVPSKRGRALLAALALAPGHRLSRQALVALLWPDRDDAQARASLRQELSVLKKALGSKAAAILQTDAHGVTMARDGIAACDVWSILADDASPETAMNLFRGELLDGLDLPFEAFEEWLSTERGVLRRRLTELAERHLDERAGVEDWAAVETCAERLQDLDPFNERAVAALMRAASAGGRRTQALSLFDDFAARLQRELQVKPGDRLVRLRDEIASDPGSDPAVVKTDKPNEVLFERPAVLVMAVDCLSTSEDDRMLADGLTEEIRTTLSYWRWFPVIGPESIGWKTARNTDIREAARGVSASYAVTGSLRRFGERARITVSLVDTASGRSLWSQNFDGNLEDVFAFQEDVCRSIVAQIEPQIAHAEAERIQRSPPTDLAAWQLVARTDEIERLGGPGYGTPESNARQLPLLQKATEIEPGYARAWSRIAKVHWRYFIMGWREDRDACALESREASRRAITLDPNDWEAHAYQALVQVFALKDYAAGEYHCSEAVRLNPSASLARQATGCTMEWMGRPRVALDNLELIFRLDPDPAAKAAIFGDMTTCYMFAGDTERSVEIARQLMAIGNDYSRGLQRCAATFGHAGETELAKAAVARLGEIHPDFSEDYVRMTYPFSKTEDLDFFIEGLRKAGCWS